MLEPTIENFKEKKFIGHRITMSLAANMTGNLWRTFMPVRKEITNTLGSELYSIEVYDSSYFNRFTPTKEFEKWAAMAVHDLDSIPPDMESIVIPSGLYAVFIHRGPASTGPNAFRYIFETWLPQSIYVLDQRPHFEIMDEKYKGEDSTSEEALWIPIRLK